MTNETASVENVRHDLFIANRAFSAKGVIDNFGHVSARHPSRADRFFLYRSRSPSLVTRDDLLGVTLEGDLVTPDPRRLCAEQIYPRRNPSRAARLRLRASRCGPRPM
jgi:ribulose-5-phosphate 4-epimerase/fuculose-1-phosphate aldolase